MINTSSLKFLLLLPALLLWLPFVANAQTTQSDGNLEVTFETVPIFNALNIAPGFTEVKTVTVKNNGTEVEDVYVSAVNATSTGLADFVNLTISSTSTTPNQLFADSFTEFFNQSPIDLDDLAAGQARTYVFEANFIATSSNTYNGTSMGFDLVVGFESGPAVTTPGTGGGGGGGGSSGGSAPSSGPTPQVAGVFTNPGIWEQFLEGIRDTVEGMQGRVLGEEALATTTADISGDFPSADTLGITTEAEEVVKSWLCEYLWVLIVLWVTATAVAYWYQLPREIRWPILLIEGVFGLIALAFTISYFVFGVPCVLWPSLVVLIGSTVIYYFNKDGE